MQILPIRWHYPDRCPQCESRKPLSGHGFYRRTLVDLAFDGVIRVRRYLCRCCKRTVSLLPEFALAWLRFSISVIALFLVAHLFRGLMLAAAALAAGQGAMRRISVGSSGFAVFKNKLPCSAWRWRHSRPRQPHPISCRVRSAGSNPSAGSPLTASCFPGCARTCWAGPERPRGMGA